MRFSSFSRRGKGLSDIALTRGAEGDLVFSDCMMMTVGLRAACTDVSVEVPSAC